MSSGAKVRALAAKTVSAVLTGSALDEPLAKYKAGLSDIDQRFLSALAYGTLRRFPRHVAVIEHLLRNPKKPLNPMMRALLMVGLEQIVATRVPPHAAVSATVAASRFVNQAKGSGFLNAILRRYLREEKDIEEALKADVRVKYEHPSWLVEKIRTDWPDDWEQVLAANNLAPPFWLRVNLQKTTRREYLESLAALDIAAQSSALNATGIRLIDAVSVEQLPHFADGWVSVQDIGAQLAAPLVNAQPGERILDACAAPGGKTTHILECCPDAEVTALDISGARLERVRDNCKRTGATARLITANAAVLEDWWDREPFDAVLIDAPCTGSGVIRRHPDIKMLRRPKDATGFALAQRLLIEALWETIAPGGRLIYATCSIFPEENEDLIEALIPLLDGAHPDLPHGLNKWGKLLKNGVQMLPDATSSDGFYYAALTKHQKREF